MATKMFMNVMAKELGIQKERSFSIFTLSYDLLVANEWFKKRDVTRVNAIQIDYLLTRMINRGSYLDCKVISGECEVTRHKLQCSGESDGNFVVKKDTT